MEGKHEDLMYIFIHNFSDKPSKMHKHDICMSRDDIKISESVITKCSLQMEVAN